MRVFQGQLMHLALFPLLKQVVTLIEQMAALQLLIHMVLVLTQVMGILLAVQPQIVQKLIQAQLALENHLQIYHLTYQYTCGNVQSRRFKL